MAARGAAASRTGGVPVDDAAAEAKDASSEASWVTKGLVVLPGDDVTDAILQVADTARIGVGLSQSSDGSVTATKAGTLSFTPPSAFWVNTSQKRVSDLPTLPMSMLLLLLLPLARMRWVVLLCMFSACVIAPAWSLTHTPLRPRPRHRGAPLVSTCPRLVTP